MINYEDIMKEKEHEFEKLSNYAKEKEAVHNEEMDQIQEELLRIQGEYRMLNRLKEKASEEEKEACDTAEEVVAEIVEEK